MVVQPCWDLILDGARGLGIWGSDSGTPESRQESDRIPQDLKGSRQRALVRLLELIYLKDPENSWGLGALERVHEVGIPKDGDSGLGGSLRPDFHVG